MAQCTIISPKVDQTFQLPYYSGQATTTHTQAFQLELFEFDADVIPDPSAPACTTVDTLFSDYTFSVKSPSDATYQDWETVKTNAPYDSQLTITETFQVAADLFSVNHWAFSAAITSAPASNTFEFKLTHNPTGFEFLFSVTFVEFTFSQPTTFWEDVTRVSGGSYLISSTKDADLTTGVFSNTDSFANFREEIQIETTAGVWSDLTSVSWAEAGSDSNLFSTINTAILPSIITGAPYNVRMILWFVNQQCIPSVTCAAETMIALVSTPSPLFICEFYDTTIDLIAGGAPIVEFTDSSSTLTQNLQMPTANDARCLQHSFNSLNFVTVAADFTTITINRSAGKDATLTATSTFFDQTWQRSIQITICGADGLTTDLFTSGEPAKIYFYQALGETRLSINPITSLASQSGIPACQWIADIKNSASISLKTTLDVHWDEVNNEIFRDSVDPSLIGKKYTFTFEIYFPTDTATPVATKTGVVEFVQCTYTPNSGKALGLLNTLDIYIGQNAISGSLDYNIYSLDTVTQPECLPTPIVTMTPSSSIFTQNNNYEALQLQVTIGASQPAVTHTIKVTHTIPSGETLDLASVGTVNIIPCLYTGLDSISTDPFNTDPLNPVIGTDMDVTVLSTTTNPLNFDLVMPVNTPSLTQCDYSLSYTAVVTATSDDATSIVTLNSSNGKSSLDVANDYSTVNQQLTVTVKWTLIITAGVDLAEATINVNIVNCINPTQAQITVGAHNPINPQHYQVVPVPVPVPQIDYNYNGIQAYELEVDNTGTTPNAQTFQLKQFIQNAKCGKLTPTWLVQPAGFDSNSQIQFSGETTSHSSLLQITIYLDQINTNVATTLQEITVTLTATNDHGASISDYKVIFQVYRCNNPTPNQPSFFSYQMNTAETKTLAFQENTNLYKKCNEHGYTFEVGGKDISTIDWLTASAATSANGIINTGLTITHHASMTAQEGGYSGNRVIKGVKEPFYILICNLEHPVGNNPYSPSTAIFEIPPPPSWDIQQQLKLNAFIMKPLDLGTSGATCDTYTTSLSFHDGTTLFSMALNGNFYDAEFTTLRTSTQQTVTVTYSVTFAPSTTETVTFPIYFCQFPDFSPEEAVVSSSSATPPIKEGLDTFVIDVNAASPLDKELQFNIVRPTPTQCNFLYTFDFSPADKASWFTGNANTVQLTAAESDVTVYNTDITLTVTAKVASFTNSITQKIKIRNCMHDTAPDNTPLPVREDIYLMVGETKTDSLAIADWFIQNPYCQPYYFQIQSDSTNNGYVRQWGGMPGDSEHHTHWATNFSQNTTDSHFTYDLKVWGVGSLQTWNSKLVIKNKDGQSYESPFLIKLYKLEFANNFYKTSVDVYQVALDHYQVPRQIKDRNDNDISATVLLSNEYGENNVMVSQSPRDVQFAMEFKLEGSETLSDWLTVKNGLIDISADYMSTPGTAAITRLDTLVDASFWQDTTLTFTSKYGVWDPTGAGSWVTKKTNSAERVWEGIERTMTYEIIDCVEALTIPNAASLFTKTSPTDKPLYENPINSFTVVLYSTEQTYFNVQLDQAQTVHNNLCGALEYTVSMTGSNVDRVTYVNGADPILLRVNSDYATEADLTLIISAQNKYDKKQIVFSEIRWRSCEASVPFPNVHQGVDDVVTTTLVDYTDVYQGGSEVIVGDKVTHDRWGYPADEQYCIVNTYEFECEDPDGRKTIYTTLTDTFTLNQSTACGYFTVKEVNSNNKAQGTERDFIKIKTDHASFQQANEGTYTLTVNAYMLIRNNYAKDGQGQTYVASRRQSQTASKTWSKVIQADCGDDTVGGSIINAVVANRMIGTIVVKIADEVELNFGTTPLFTMKYKNTCTFQLKITRDALVDAVSPSFISVVQADNTITVSASSLNSDFPMDIAERPTKTFTYYLRAETPENYKVYNTNNFQVTTTLNCEANFLKLNTPLFDKPLQVSSGSLVQSINKSNASDIVGDQPTFQKVKIAHSDNSQCDIKDSSETLDPVKLPAGYILKQRGFDDPTLNVNYDLLTMGFYDTKLVAINVSPQDEDNFSLEFKIHDPSIISVVTYDVNTRTVCRLDDATTTSCDQVFDVYANSYDGIIDKIAEYTMTFKSECYEIKELYDTTDKNTFWQWDHTDFATGYDIRDPTTIFKLPKVSYLLPSQHNAIEYCHTVSYEIVNPDSEIFSNFANLDSVGDIVPTFETYTDDSSKTITVQPYSLGYIFEVTVYFDLYKADSTLAWSDTDYDRTIYITDICLSLTYARPPTMPYIRNHYGETATQQANSLNLIIEYSVMSEPERWDILLNTYKLPDGTYSRLQLCGTSRYEHKWIIQEDQRESSINEDMWKVTEASGFNAEDGSQPLTFDLHTKRNEDVGEYYYYVQVRMIEVNLTSVFDEITITMKIKPCVSTLQKADQIVDPLTVYFGQDEQTFIWDSFRQEPACNYTWTYQVYIDQGGRGHTIDEESAPGMKVEATEAEMENLQPIDPPIILSYNSTQRQIVMQATGFDQIGKVYDVYINGKLDYFNYDPELGKATQVWFDQRTEFYEEKMTPFKVIIGEPYWLLFNSQPTVDWLPYEVILYQSDNYTINFGEAYDIENNTVTVKQVTFRTADGGLDYPEWVTLFNATLLKNVRLEIRVPPNATVNQHLILQIVFQDNHLRDPMQTTYYVNIYTKERKALKESEFDSSSLFNQTVEDNRDANLPPPIMSINETMTDDGRIMISFNRPVNFKLPPPIKRQLQDDDSDSGKEVVQVDLADAQTNVANSSNSTDTSPLEDLALLNSLNRGPEFFNILYKPSMSSRQLQNYEQVDVSFFWSIELINEFSFFIVIKFSDYLYVSQNQNMKDNLIINVLQTQQFVADDGKPASSPKSFQQLQVPTFEQPSYIQTKTERDLSDGFARMVTIIMGGNFFVSLIFASALQYLWGMVNALQIMVLAVLFDILLPSNVMVILREITKACNFDFFYTADLYTIWFGFEQTVSYNDHFQLAGFEGSNFIIGLGTIFIFIVIFPFTVLLKIAMRYVFQQDCQSRCLNNFMSSRDNIPIFMTFLLESCVEIGFQCCICLLMVNEDRWSTIWEALGISLAVILGISLFIAPIYLFVMGLKLYSANKKGDEEQVEKYRDLFSDKRLSSRLAIQYSTIFFLRRYLLIMLLMSNKLGNSVSMITIHAALLISCITLHAKPFEIPSMNRQEVFNEGTVMLAGYVLLHYTDYVPDGETRYLFGWINIGIIGFNLVINLAIMMLTSGHICKLKVKRFSIHHSAKKRIEARDAEKLRLEQNKQTIIKMFPGVGTIFDRAQAAEAQEQEQSENSSSVVSEQELRIEGLPQQNDNEYVNSVSSDVQAEIDRINQDEGQAPIPAEQEPVQYVNIPIKLKQPLKNQPIANLRRASVLNSSGMEGQTVEAKFLANNKSQDQIINEDAAKFDGLIDSILMISEQSFGDNDKKQDEKDLYNEHSSSQQLLNQSAASLTHQITTTQQKQKKKRFGKKRYKSNILKNQSQQDLNKIAQHTLKGLDLLIDASPLKVNKNGEFQIKSSFLENNNPPVAFRNNAQAASMYEQRASDFGLMQNSRNPYSNNTNNDVNTYAANQFTRKIQPQMMQMNFISPLPCDENGRPIGLIPKGLLQGQQLLQNKNDQSRSLNMLQAQQQNDPSGANAFPRSRANSTDVITTNPNPMQLANQLNPYGQASSLSQINLHQTHQRNNLFNSQRNNETSLVGTKKLSFKD